MGYLFQNKEAVQQSTIGRKRKANRALNPKRSKIFSAKSNCGTASKILKVRDDKKELDDVENEHRMF
jgi:hypothetical protein